MKRRSFLQSSVAGGSLAMPGLFSTMGQVMAQGNAGASQKASARLHHFVDVGRAEPNRHVRHEAQARERRRIFGSRHQRARHPVQRTFAGTCQAGRQAGDRPNTEQQRGRPRTRFLSIANRAKVGRAGQAPGAAFDDRPPIGSQPSDVAAIGFDQVEWFLLRQRGRVGVPGSAFSTAERLDVFERQSVIGIYGLTQVPLTGWRNQYSHRNSSHACGQFASVIRASKNGGGNDACNCGTPSSLSSSKTATVRN